MKEINFLHKYITLSETVVYFDLEPIWKMFK